MSWKACSSISAFMVVDVAETADHRTSSCCRWRRVTSDRSLPDHLRLHAVIILDVVRSLQLS